MNSKDTAQEYNKICHKVLTTCPVCNKTANKVDMIATSYYYCGICKEDVEFLRKTKSKVEPTKPRDRIEWGQILASRGYHSPMQCADRDDFIWRNGRFQFYESELIRGIEEMAKKLGINSNCGYSCSSTSISKHCSIHFDGSFLPGVIYISHYGTIP